MALQVVARPLGRRFVLAAPLVLAAACARGQEAEIQFKRSSLLVVTSGREIKFEVDLATNDAERSLGLMYRKQLGAYEGMLFDFYQEMPVSFWMKNTLIPLDMIFIRADGTVARIEANTVPLSLEPVMAGEPVTAVLELAGGRSAELNIGPGAKVDWQK